MTVDTTKTDTDAGAARHRSISIPISTVAWGTALAAVTILAVTLAGFLFAARNDLADRDAVAADNKHAEQVATDYAVGASTVNYAEFASWVGRLKQNTAPTLANKFDTTAPKLEELLTPLKWTSTANPITAKVVSDNNGVYQVDVFVNVSSTNAQNPDGAQTTVTYAVTVDRHSDWKITDVGGGLPMK
jgi:Mce-associated membrane protein